MSLVAISGNASGTGTLTIAAPNTNSNYTLTLPQTTATLNINGPAFSVYLSGTPSVTPSTFTKVQFNVEEFDTNSNYDNVTNYRFTPTIAGYYQINAGISAAGTSVTRIIAILYKNGASYKNGFDVSGTPNKGGVSALVYLNGSTDYIEIYGYLTGTSPTFFGNSDLSNVWFNGVLVRGA